MLAFSNDYYGIIFRATQSVELFCAYQSLTLLILIVNIEIHCFKGFYSLEPQKRERTFDFHFVRSLFLKVLYNL